MRQCIITTMTEQGPSLTDWVDCGCSCSSLWLAGGRSRGRRESRDCGVTAQFRKQQRSQVRSAVHDAEGQHCGRELSRRAALSSPPFDDHAWVTKPPIGRVVNHTVHRTVSALRGARIDATPAHPSGARGLTEGRLLIEPLGLIS